MQVIASSGMKWHTSVLSTSFTYVFMWSPSWLLVPSSFKWKQLIFMECHLLYICCYWIFVSRTIWRRFSTSCYKNKKPNTATFAVKNKKASLSQCLAVWELTLLSISETCMIHGRQGIIHLKVPYKKLVYKSRKERQKVTKNEQ